MDDLAALVDEELGKVPRDALAEQTLGAWLEKLEHPECSELAGAVTDRG